jgi:hypothetical protein
MIPDTSLYYENGRTEDCLERTLPTRTGCLLLWLLFNAPSVEGKEKFFSQGSIWYNICSKLAILKRFCSFTERYRDERGKSWLN